MATPHNSARKLSERFRASSKFQKRGNTVCISRFWNCRNDAKDPLRSADAIVRCCHILSVNCNIFQLLTIACCDRIMTNKLIT